MRIHRVFSILTISLAFTLGACSDGDGGSSTLEIDLQGVTLPDLGPDYVYEGWIIVDDSPVSTGTFTIDTNGDPVPGTFTVDRAQMEAATMFVISIEPVVDPDPAPSDTKILAGPVSPTSMMNPLTVDAVPALGTNFSNAAGDYILATPTSNATDDETQGIWWLDPGAGPGASLTLPALPAGWIYEGWVVVGGTPISTGTFSAVDGADSDGAGSTAGTDGAGPPFPGQDFVNPATDLIGGAAVISVEPVPDNSPEPFMIKPLTDEMIEDAGGPQSMANSAGTTIPSATLHVHDFGSGTM